jgi:diguanylate cyclase (GGDEF)-like protein
MPGKFLIASSSEPTMRALRLALRDDRHTITMAHDGLEVVDLALDRQPNAIFLGVHLPGLDGLDVARSLRALGPTERIPLVFLAENEDEAKQISEAHLALTECLTAPYDLGEVKAHALASMRTGERIAALPPTGSESAWMLTMIDPLTHLYHRRYLLHLLAYEAARSARYKTPLAVLLVDIDNLKEINHQHGILMGDTVLVEVGQLLKKMLRGCDVIGRSNTQDFMLIVPQTDERGARILASRICQTISEHHFILEKLDLHVTVSVGVVCAAGNDLTENLALLGRAEIALQHAKRAGKNRAEVG